MGQILPAYPHLGLLTVPPVKNSILERAITDLGMALLKGDHAGRKGKRATSVGIKHHDGT